ncbi:MAG: efflux RND transporter periplasmic adaptor subunit [Gemmatimonadota bacterium]|nr:efflux RND transporter periplasmic adaptor subunit [Gemmatimonadota bacterium]
MSNFQRWLVFGVIAVLAGCEEGERGPSRRGGQRRGAAVPVKVEPVNRRDISSSILANTTLEAFQWVEVRSRASGQVVEILKEEGDRVTRGAVLARLDSEEPALQVKRMEVAYQDARRAYERDEKLFKRELLSNERYENSRGQMDRAQTELEQAKLNLSYTSIVSPLAGTVTIRSVEVGNMITANQAVFSVADFDPLLARIRIPEKNMGKVAIGQGAKVSVESDPGRLFGGVVKMISPVVDPESGTIKVTIQIPGGGNGVLRPGMFASVHIITEVHRNTLVIPKRALVLEGEGNHVFVYEPDGDQGGGKAVRRKVGMGFADNEHLEILKGLTEGEQVITIGHDGLRPGTAVRLVGEGVPETTAAGTRMDGGRESGQPAGGDNGQLNAMKERMFARFPDLKKAYDARVKKDPDLATSGEKWRAFMGEMRRQGILPGRGGRPQ